MTSEGSTLKSLWNLANPSCTGTWTNSSSFSPRPWFQNSPESHFHNAARAHVLNATLTMPLAEKERVSGLCCSHTCTAHPSQHFKHFPSAQSKSSLKVCSHVLRLAILLNPKGLSPTSSLGLSLPKDPAGPTKCLVAYYSHDSESLLTSILPPICLGQGNICVAQ